MTLKQCVNSVYTVSNNMATHIAQVVDGIVEHVHLVRRSNNFR